MTDTSLSRRKSVARVTAAFPYRDNAPLHEVVSQQCLARRLARLLGTEFLANYEPAMRATVDAVYYVPSRTLVTGGRQAGETQLTDIHTDDDLFGGVVPYSFVATKAITHGLLEPTAAAPEGWSRDFHRKVERAVLRGYTVFSMEDARRAGALLLREGPIRIKPVRASGGRGQTLVDDLPDLEAGLEALNRVDLTECGLVLEEHLEDVKTFSVGRVNVANLIATYVGTQSLTPDNAGQLVYGGSELFFARGDFEALLQLNLQEDERRAVQLALIYDRAAMACYPGLYASRRNYDIAQGRDSKGRTRAGVLEQSWRAGGASMAEACALEAFQSARELKSVRAFTCERYGAHQPPPPDTQLIFRGEDTETGFITKYGGISFYGDS